MRIQICGHTRFMPFHAFVTLVSVIVRATGAQREIKGMRLRGHGLRS